jgi:signal transduction histidine kinase
VNSILIGLVLGLLLMGLAILIINFVKRWWLHRQFGVPVNHSSLMVEYGRKMTSAPDRATLENLLVKEFPCALDTEHAALLLTEGHNLVSKNGDGLHLPISHAAVRWVASSGEAQEADRGRLYEIIPEKPIDLTWTSVWVPLMRGVDLRGMWLLGARQSNRRYSREDLRCLTAIGRQAAMVLETIYYTEQERWAASEMRSLYRQAVAAREAERARIARELHDGVLQDMCAVTRDLKALESNLESDKPAFNDLAIRSGGTVQALRAVCNDLRPPLLRQDLMTALKALIKDLDARSTAPVHIEISVNEVSIVENEALAIFRIAQEALHNAIQHADASEIAVRLTQYPDRLRLTVTDDGCGIAGGVEPARFVAEGHYGLAGMRERAAMIGGHLEVQTAIDYGTVVILELPQK